MSANLDLVRSIFAAWERGDFSSADWAGPEIEFVIVDGIYGESATGLPERAEGFRGFLSTWDRYSIEADEYCELDSQRVLVLVHDGGRGRASGLDLGSIKGERAMLFHVGHGREAFRGSTGRREQVLRGARA